MKHIGSLIVRTDNLAYAATVSEVSGDLYILAAKASLTALTSVGKCLFIRAADASLTALTNVGQSLFVEARNANMPLLNCVCESLVVRAPNASLPLLAGVGINLFVQATNASLPVLKCVGKSLYVEPKIEFDHSRIRFRIGKALAVSWYTLHATKQGLYFAGCRGPWTAEECFEHWNDMHPNQVRAKAFTKAIKAHRAAKPSR